MSRQCRGCAARPPRRGQTLCNTCQTTVHDHLTELPDLTHQLWITVTRQDRIPRGGEGYNPNTTGMILYPVWHTTLRDDAYWLIDLWHDNLGNTNTHHPDLETRFRHRCHQLAQQINTIARHDHAGRLHNQIVDLAEDIRRAIDRPPDLIYADICRTQHATPPPGTPPGDGTARGASAGWRCDEPIYAQPGAAQTTCPRCGTVHDVKARRARMLHDVEDRLVTAAEAAILATYLGQLTRGRDQVRKQINQWHSRSRIAARATWRGQPVFTFGEILQLLIEKEQQR